jgi:hypothetical protein
MKGVRLRQPLTRPFSPIAIAADRRKRACGQGNCSGVGDTTEAPSSLAH